mmetsp:Transcript_36479/g.66851  ORF Transcript_36479/g.66851 Transcript_36479/m.66851 type:complete len:88 (+) Transcript_36479:103-366(+)
MGACCHSARLLEGAPDMDCPLQVHHSAEDSGPMKPEFRAAHVSIAPQATTRLPATCRKNQRIPTGFVRHSDVNLDEELDECSDKLEP